MKAAIEREWVSQATSRTLAGIETALRGRRNVTWRPSKRHFVGVETYFRQPRQRMEGRRLEVLCDLGVVEIVHLVHHANGRIDDGEGAKGSRALSETQT